MGALHSEILSKHLAKRVLDAMMNPDAPPWLFEPKLAELVATKKPAEKTPRNAKKDPPVPLEETPPPGGDQDSQPNMLDKLKLMLQNQSGQA